MWRTGGDRRAASPDDGADPGQHGAPGPAGHAAGGEQGLPTLPGPAPEKPGTYAAPLGVAALLTFTAQSGAVYSTVCSCFQNS